MSTEEQFKAISESFTSTESLIQVTATENPNVFLEYVLKDNKGNKVVQDAIHLEIQWHIEECRRRGLPNCGILAPWGHGKTEQLIGRVLDWIGQDPNIRIQYICNTDDNAAARVMSVRKYLEQDEDYHKVYPHILPQRDQWGKHKIIVQRLSKAKDGTLESWGITSSGTGSRSDIQIFDDPVDMRNAILNPAMRPQVKESFYNVWLSRLVPSGFRIYIATVWHEDDLTHELQKNPEWNFLVMKVSEDFGSIECESAFKGKYTISLWKSQWSVEKLKGQLRLIGTRAFERGYRQKALSDEDRTFPSSESIFNWSLDDTFIEKHWPRVCGVDPFGQYVVFFILALSPTNHKRYPLKIIRGNKGEFDPKTTIKVFKEVLLEHNPQLFVVENNAAQEAITQWAQEVHGANLNVLPFVTGIRKADPVMGLPSIEVEFANGAWEVPCKGIDPTDYEHPFNVWRNEMKSHPISSTQDCVMAMWFAREAARFLTGWEPEPKNPPPISQEEALEGEDFQQVKIGEY